MCQTIGTCYVETTASPFVGIREKADYWLFHNPRVNSEELKEYIVQLCKSHLFELKIFLECAKKDFEESRNLVDNPNESEAVRTINKSYCEFYERVLAALGSERNKIKGGV